MLSRRGRVLLAVSGGPDSVALMRLFARVASDADRGNMEAATVDHGLRPESRDEAERVGGWARDSGFAHRILAWQGEKPKARIQERARAARYALLAARAGEIGADVIVTAHTLDDQAETVLMRMARGSGVSGLAAMRAFVELGEITLARPLLGVPKARLVATCAHHGWPFLTDPSNADSRFARARWRKLSAALAAEGLSARRLAKLAERAAAVDDALETKASEAFDAVLLSRSQNALILDAGRLLGSEPHEIALRVLQWALRELDIGRQGPALRLERAEALTVTLREAFAAGKPMRRTLGGAIFAFDGKGSLAITREGPRHRGEPRRSETENAGASSGARKVKKGNSNAQLALV